MSSVLAVSLLGGCRASDKPVTLTVWTYYNGDQLASFERLVEEFNTTIGKKEHITVEASSQGSINDLEKNVLDAAKGRVGALAMPNIFSAYADTAYTLEQMGQVVDLSPYLTEKEKAAYLPNYLEEGDFSDDSSIHIILTTSTKFLRIMEMASIELGGYEMRFDLNTVYVTKNFFPMLNLPSEDVSELSTRYFGDEFNLLFYGYQSQEEIRALLQNLSLAVSNTALELPSGRKLPLRLSGGVSWYPENSTDLSTLKKYADFAMYQVKKAEKGYITEFDLELFTKNAKETEMRRLFHKMLNEELFTYYFQPIVSAADGSIYAYEALMRGNLPALTRPDQILQLAHEEECLHEIERLTMFLSAKSYATFLSTHQIRGDELLFVNSIASQYMNHDEAVAYVEQYSFLQDRIVIEITEEDSPDLTALLKKREMPGFSGVFALDDYGSGYSNEKMLLELAPAYIKLDLSIIRDIDSDPDKQQIVENIVSYAHQRGMKIIAEGLETPAELLKVLELDVDLLQGYFLAKPSAVPKPVSAESVAVIEHFRKHLA
ncbi:MAG: EAL domain-containing protein [Fusicatenibacter saccharivorans]